MLMSCTTFFKPVAKMMRSERVEVAPPKGSKSKAASISTVPSIPQTVGEAPTMETLTGGQWTFASVGADMIQPGDTVPYIYFDKSGRFYASSNCNFLNGIFSLRSDGTLVFDDVEATKNYCRQMPYAHQIEHIFTTQGKVIADCRTAGHETFLALKNAKGNKVAVLRRHNMEFLNGHWRISQAEGKVVNDEEANIFIDTHELKIHGNTGSAFFNGELFFNPSRSNAVDFSNIIVSTNNNLSDLHRRIIVGLEQTQTAVSDSSGSSVIMLDASGKELLKMRRL